MCLLLLPIDKKNAESTGNEDESDDLDQVKVSATFPHQNKTFNIGDDEDLYNSQNELPFFICYQNLMSNKTEKCINQKVLEKQ